MDKAASRIRLLLEISRAVFIVHESASVTSKHKKGLLCSPKVIVQESKEAPFAL